MNVVAPPSFHLRELDAANLAETEWVALGMHLTLAEVNGERGRERYPLTWMRERLKALLDPAQHVSQVYLAARDDDPAAIAGHTILRIDRHPDGRRFGLFSTTYVDPPLRRAGLADRLLERGERWIRSQGLDEAATWTSSTNLKLIRLYEKHGYAITDSGMNEESLMVRLTKSPTA